jgi:hypothetical protein
LDVSQEVRLILLYGDEIVAALLNTTLSVRQVPALARS